MPEPEAKYQKPRRQAIVPVQNVPDRSGMQLYHSETENSAAKCNCTASKWHCTMYKGFPPRNISIRNGFSGKDKRLIPVFFDYDPERRTF
jgi:hypothetical protein